MRNERNSMDYVKQVRAMRARYLRGLLKKGWKIVFSVFLSVLQSPKRTVISIARNSDQAVRG